MKKIVDWINSHKIITICITLFLFVVQPIIVHWMFKTKAATPFWEKTWEAGDLLGYIAGFEAFIGTVFLGVVAVRQNDKANQLNEHLIDIEEKSSTLVRCPNLDIDCKNIEVTTLGQIFELNSMVLCTHNTQVTTENKPVDWESPQLFLTLRLHNLSSSNLIVNCIHLEVTPVENQTNVRISDFETLSYRASSLHISPSNEKDLGIIIDYTKYPACIQFDAIMHLLVINNILDEFLFSIKFTAYSMDNGKHKFFYLTNISHHKK